ncbi:hypothetical protein MMC25_003048 [Agyrium rufum]|nr:hypothetical protein [Agyrium rufum]
MAPNKGKKKKPAANPARGFATTSIQSKSKVIEAEVVPDVIENEVHVGKEGKPGNEMQATSKPAEKQIEEVKAPDLSPEEWEAQQEESNLRLLVEKNAEKVKKGAARQVTRLQIERRLLRSQAEFLSLQGWLSEELIGSIVSQSQATANSGTGISLNGNTSRPSEELPLKVWTLQLTLKDLGLSDEVLSATLRGILFRELKAGDYCQEDKDSVWGLQNALEWMALHCGREDLPGYNQISVKAIDSAQYPARIDFEEHKKEQINTGSRQNTNGHNDDPEMSDDNVEPHKLTNRYIELQSRLFRRQPELTALDYQPVKGKKGRRTVKEQTIDDADLITKRLVTRIKKLQRDMLFDRDEAHEKWYELRLGMLKEAAERRKLQLDTPAQPEATQLSPAITTPTTVTNSDDEDSSNGVGDFFASLPETSVDALTGQTSTSVSNADGGNVNLRSFAASRGLSPRKILEEACKARDSSSKVVFKVLSRSSFSVRAGLIIRWSSDVEIPDLDLLPGLNVEANPRTLKIEMRSISTPDASQAEAYVSTAAIHLVFASSTKEKVHLRLPPVWRDLWDEFMTLKTKQVENSDVDTIKQINQVVEEVESMSTPAALDIGPLAQQLDALEVTETSSRGRVTLNQNIESRDLVSIWKAKSSTAGYHTMFKARSALPIWSFKDELLSAMASYQAIIICGETGCGKSTQVPSMILEEQLANGKPCKIYCAEPRRISAISLARRVSEELGEQKSDVGTSRSLVGYAIRLESQVTSQTRLIFATTGILMRMLERADDLGDVSHLILDEVHERTIDSDFLLIVLRKLMVRRPELRVILMSATVNAEQFSRYLGGAPVLNVPGRTYPVDTKFLEDAIETTNYRGGKGSSAANEEVDEEDEEEINGMDPKPKSNLNSYSANTRNVLADHNEYRIDYELVIQLLDAIATKPVYGSYSKAILVFLPGIAEIRRLNDILAGHRTFSRDWYVYPLHSTIATEEQERAFLIPPPGIRKIVLATNIAETGITIPDVTCVVDTGKHREMRFDERRQLSRLIESFISRANAKQRRGRAGRVQNGLCFHLFTKARHDTVMAEQQTPEMLRLSLQDLVLRVKICKLGGIEETLLEALDPPLPKNIRRAVDSLIDVGALRIDEKLTPLGRQLAKLPLDVFLGKLILLGTIFKCLDPMLSIAAILSSKSPFSAPMGSRAQADLARLSFKKGDSDLLTIYNAYATWRRICQTPGQSEMQFCRKHFLSPQTLSNIEELKTSLTTALVDAGFLRLNERESAALTRARFYSRQRQFVELPPAYTAHQGSELVLNSVIAWAFYPKILSRDGKGWRNAANNQSVSLHPSSVNKGVSQNALSRYLSFYSIMQSSNKFYNAQETGPVDPFAIALVCGEAEFRLYASVILLDGHRFKFALDEWKTMLAMRILRDKIRENIAFALRFPGRPLSSDMQFWWDIWEKAFIKEDS